MSNKAPLSPTLFNNNDLALNLRKSGLRIEEDLLRTVLYADNVALCAESERDLQLLVNILQQWSDKWDLEINHKGDTF